MGKHSRGKMHFLPCFFFVLWILSDRAVDSESIVGCGQIDESIANLDERARAPWIASVYYQSSQCDFRPGSFGNGVIIGPTTIIMSGNFLWASNHKESSMFGFKPNTFMVAVGLKAKFFPVQPDNFTQFIKVDNVQPHQKSYGRYSEYDYAIVHLKNPIQFSTRVRPICLETLPEAIFENMESPILQNDLFLTGYGTPGNFPKTKKFEFRSEEYCRQKLSTNFFKSQVSNILRDMETPCGIIHGTTLEETENLGDRRFLVSNVCYQKGAALTTKYKNRWYLIGLLSESLGYSCDKSLYFISLVSLKSHLRWILNGVRNSPHSFICFNSQQVNIKNELCNNFKDCDDGSDENEIYCEARKCRRFSQYCTSCSDNETFKIQRGTYSFSTSVASKEIRCPAIIPPQEIDVICEEQDLRERISCKNGGSIGSKAIFRCKRFDYFNPVPTSYCVVTCQPNGEWSEGLSILKCSSFNGDHNTDPVPVLNESELIADRLNFTAWLDEVIRQGAKTSTELPSTNINSITETNSLTTVSNSGTNMCPGFINKKGITVTCRDAFSLTKITDCSNGAAVGTKAEFSCNRYYKPVLTSNSLVKTCGPNGKWSLENRRFECRLDCGLPKSYLIGHIVNGVSSDEASWPWHAIIFVKTKTGDYTYICGATLISKKIILTAAHCVSFRNGLPMASDKYKIILGASSSVFKDNYGDPHAQIFDIKDIFINPAFNPKTFEADIAIVRLNKSAEISDYVRPSCFPTSSTVHNELLHTSPGSSGNIIGFGYDESGTPSKILKEATLPVVSYSECYRVLNIQPSSTMYCAGYTNGTSACSGDSGGGQFFSDEVYPNRLFLQGIVSHGNSDKATRLCDHNQYTVFTKVSSFKNWIFEQSLELDEEF